MVEAAAMKMTDTQQHSQAHLPASSDPPPKERQKCMT